MNTTINKVKIDMWFGDTYDPKRHTVPALYWSDGRSCYWGWIYDEGKMIGDFTAESALDVEKALCVRFKYN